jgi:YHYH protein/Secretion system C-terminal sorting domain
MKKRLLSAIALTLSISMLFAQTNPAITSWLQNTTVTGRYYTVAGGSTSIPNNILVNCQKVEYSANFAYVTCTGIPAYATGPFQDGNPSQATNQNAIFKLPLNPAQNTGTLRATTAGNIGVFINGVALYDYRDGVAWNATTNALCGGPGNPMCPGGMGTAQAWNRDAILAERAGFDCAKGHPAMGNYHHHQNPSAFDLDLTIISTVCNLYDADGLYIIDSTKHSPLLGFAYDGFPIYGAYGYKNTDGTGGITRMKSGYRLKTTRGTGTVPPVATYPLGYFREDYEFFANTASDYLDVHNGRICKTPEYPNGIYCYFSTVDARWNSAYPYVVGPNFYGVVSVSKVASVTEPVSTYTKITPTDETTLDNLQIKVFPNPSADLISIQIGDLVKEDYSIELFDAMGKLVKSTQINKGSTIAYFDTQALYDGTYVVKISNGQAQTTRKVLINK